MSPKTLTYPQDYQIDHLPNRQRRRRPLMYQTPPMAGNRVIFGQKTFAFFERECKNIRNMKKVFIIYIYDNILCPL